MYIYCTYTVRTLPVYTNQRCMKVVFVRSEKRGFNGAKYYYLCSYDPRTRNVHKRYLGPVGGAAAENDANFFRWLNTLNEQKVKKLRDESLAVEKLKLDFHTAMERVLELGEFIRQK
jgi:hypothetical protein